MKHFFVTLFLLGSVHSYSQNDTAHYTTRYKNGMINEDYIISNTGVKNGAYTRYTRYGKKYITGQYTSGEPTGIWEFFSSDTSATLVQRLDFNAHKELFVDPLRVHALICGPRYFGGNMVEQEYIQRHIKKDFTAEEQSALHGISYTVSFTVDSVSYKPVMITTNEKNAPAAVKKKMEAIVSEMPEWLPPVCAESPSVWRFSVTFVF